MKKRIRGPFVLLPLVSALLVSVLAGAGAGSSQGLIAMPPVGLAARSPLSGAPGGTVTTPVTPTVPRGRTPGQSTITMPGVSGSSAASTVNPGTMSPF